MVITGDSQVVDTVKTILTHTTKGCYRNEDYITCVGVLDGHMYGVYEGADSTGTWCYQAFKEPIISIGSLDEKIVLSDEDGQYSHRVKGFTTKLSPSEIDSIAKATRVMPSRVVTKETAPKKRKPRKTAQERQIELPI